MRRLPPTLPLGLVIAFLTLYAYRELWPRPFAADDYQWLLNVRGLGGRALLRAAFDPGAQTHFFRPLVWLLFGAQVRAFGLDPRGFHAVSLALHLLNAGLLAALVFRLTKTEEQRPRDQARPASVAAMASSGPAFGAWPALAAFAIAALHPAPFEAVVWISAQSELLAAALLLLALHLWLPVRRNMPTRRHAGTQPGLLFFSPRVLAATLALGLALLAKESAVIGLALLVLLGECSAARPADDAARPAPLRRLAPYLLPALFTLAYIGVQVLVERRNYLLAQGGYGLGWQLGLNPLRSLALLVAPLPGTEHADNAWLVPVGALVALALLFVLGAQLWRWLRMPRARSTSFSPQSAAVLALGLTLVPTAPFVSPPDSRYLYLPVLAAALLVGCMLSNLLGMNGLRSQAPHAKPRAINALLVMLLLVALLLLGWASGELNTREARFAAGAGPGGSLWRLATAVCAQQPPEQLLIVEPPLATPHAEAIVGLACGADVRAQIVGRDQVDAAISGHAVVIAFPNGSATVERTT